MSNDAQDAAGGRVGLVGAGFIAGFHLKAVRALGDAQVVGVCDLSQARAGAFAKANGIEGAFTDIATMIKEANVDAVHVLTPPNAHLEPCLAVLEAGADLLVEKPMCHTVEACEALEAAAKKAGRALGVSHNFLFNEPYERFVGDLHEGKFGELDLVEIVWNKELGQLKGGPFGAWMLADPRNILFEVAPHCFAHAVHLIGEPEEIVVHPSDLVELPRGNKFYRRWDILAYRGNATARIRLSFVPGYPEHYIHARGLNGTAHIDFENNTYTHQQHTPHLLDIDRFANVTAGARDSMVQATGTLANFVLAKAGIAKSAGPFDASIARAVDCFYATRRGAIDERLSGEMGRQAVALGERVAATVDVPKTTKAKAKKVKAPKAKAPATVLVIGGTGFIGKGLVRKLVEAGKGVRVMSRNPSNLPAELVALGVDAVRGDFTDDAAVREALDGITHVFHLARGFGNTWPEYLEGDVEPTLQLARTCQELGVERFIYASSIAIYDAGKPGQAITEETPPVESMLRANPYARSKVENERNLLDLHEKTGFPVVIVRPGVVLGPGGVPLRWGSAAWPPETVCKLYGVGNFPLPCVRV
ncbi:MAG: NAD-dependent epimerase/dehydratase family protein, partial [Myxococcota bacterium]